MAVQNTLHCVPLRPGNDVIVMAGLIVFILFTVVPLAFMVMEVRGPGFSGKHIAAIPFIAGDVVHRNVCPFVALSAGYFPLSGFPVKLVQGMPVLGVFLAKN